MICASAAGCGLADRPDTLPETARLEDVVDWGREIRLEENDEVLNVAPMVSLDPRGGMLVADAREAQLRRYAPTGELLWKAGRRGSGPGEFSSPNAIVRLPSREILAAEFSHRFTLFDSTATRVLKTIDVPFRRVEELEVLNDSLLLVGAIVSGDFDAPLLHVWNYRTNAVVRSFGYSPFSQTRNETAPHLASWGKASIRGDTLAAIFALNDTLHFFTPDGRRIGARPIRSRHFCRVPPETPGSAAPGSDQGRWLSTFDYVDNVHWLANGDLIVTYMSLDLAQGLERPPERRWHLLRLRRDGTWDLEIRDPRLLAVDRDSEELYFVAPGAEAPNRWITARFR